MLKLGMLLAASAVFGGAPVAESRAAADLGGRWTGELVRAHCDPAVARRVLCLDLRLTEGSGRNASRWTLSVPVAGLSGISATGTGYTEQNLRFDLVRESGTITFQGEFEAGWGDGRFSFSADPAYVERTTRAGRPKPSPVELLSVAVGGKPRGEGRRYADYDVDVVEGDIGDVSVAIDQALHGAHLGVSTALRVLEVIDVGAIVSQSLGAVTPYIGDATRLGVEGARLGIQGARIGSSVAASLDLSWIGDVISSSLDAADLSRYDRYDRRHRHERSKRVERLRERDEP